MARDRSCTAPRKPPSSSSAASIAIDLAEYGIRVNCIAPGHIPTGITTYDMGPVIRAHPAAAAPRRTRGCRERRVVPRQRPPAQITGIVVPVDGGTVAGPRRSADGDMIVHSPAEAGRRTAMPADIVIRGGTVVDGSGAPGRGPTSRSPTGDHARSGRTSRRAQARRRRAASSRRASSTSTRTTTRRCSGIRRCGRRRSTA